MRDVDTGRLVERDDEVQEAHRVDRMWSNRRAAPEKSPTWSFSLVLAQALKMLLKANKAQRLRAIGR